MALTLTHEPLVHSVRIDLVVPAGADRLSVRRTTSEEAYVRGWVESSVVPGPVIVRDFEAPIGVPITYTAETWLAPAGAKTAQTGTITIPAGGCEDTWLTDLARAGNTQLIIIEAFEQLDYDVQMAVHQVIGRRAPIISGDVAHTPTFEWSFLTEDETEREAARNCLGNGVPVLLRTPQELGIGNLYMAVTSFREQRITALGSEPTRRFLVSGQQVERPDPAIYTPLAPVLWHTVESTFPTWQDVEDDRASWDALAYDWTGAEPADVPPWPPDDV